MILIPSYKTLLGKWSEVVRERDNHQCQLCRVAKQPGVVLVAHHIWGKGAYPNIRFLLANGITLCQRGQYHGCHKEEAHQNIKAFKNWVRERMGEEEWERLMLARRVMKVQDRLTVKLILKEELRILVEGRR